MKQNGNLKLTLFTWTDTDISLILTILWTYKNFNSFPSFELFEVSNFWSVNRTYFDVSEFYWITNFDKTEYKRVRTFSLKFHLAISALHFRFAKNKNNWIVFFDFWTWLSFREICDKNVLDFSEKCWDFWTQRRDLNSITAR